MSGTKLFNLNSDWIGGTELMAMSLEEKVLPLAPNLADWNWILCPGEDVFLREDGKNIVWIHLGEFEGEFSWLSDQRVAHIIFVSYYQYQRFVERFPDIDQSKCHVIRNGISPIPPVKPPSLDKIKLVFHSEPYRGLELLLNALSKIDDKNIELHILGDLDTKTIDWKSEVQDRIKELVLSDDRVICHGRVSNEDVRKQLQQSHMFAYPSTWRETSCLALIEAMSAGLYCITNSFTVLPETGIGLTKIYPFNRDLDKQSETLANEISKGIQDLRDNRFDQVSQVVKTNYHYSWKTVAKEWIKFANEIEV